MGEHDLHPIETPAEQNPQEAEQVTGEQADGTERGESVTFDGQDDADSDTRGE